MNFVNAIAITGGIGSGKSTACNLLRLYGYSIIDVDSISHNKLDDSVDEIISIFGKDVIENNKINRKKLGSIVFNNRAKLVQLESILHPKIRYEVSLQARKLEDILNGKPYFVDIPIFFELKAKNNGYDIEKVLLIYAPKNLQIERTMKRDGLSYDEAIARINNQIDIEKKKAQATYVIENTSTFKELQIKLEAFLKTLDKN